MIVYQLGSTSVILRVIMRNSSTGLPLTGLSSSSSGLIISTITDVEATAVPYTVAASNVSTIATLGTYAAPSAGKCNFAQVDATNHPGLYEIQLANARLAVSGAKSLAITWSGASSLAAESLCVPLWDINPYNRSSQYQKAMTEGYAADGTPPTVEQALFAIQQFQQEKNISGTAVTILGLDGATTKYGLTLNSATAPTVITRSS